MDRSWDRVENRGVLRQYWWIVACQFDCIRGAPSWSPHFVPKIRGDMQRKIVDRVWVSNLSKHWIILSQCAEWSLTDFLPDCTPWSARSLHCPPFLIGWQYKICIMWLFPVLDISWTDTSGARPCPGYVHKLWTDRGWWTDCRLPHVDSDMSPNGQRLTQQDQPSATMLPSLLLVLTASVPMGTAH